MMSNIIILNIKAYEKELADIKAEISLLPEGKLYVRASKFYTYYCPRRKKETSITRNSELIQKLCRRAYLEVRKSQLENNITQRISKFDRRTPRELIATLSKAYRTVPETYFYHPSISDWLATPPRFNTLNPEQAKYLYKGVNYRALSEREIAKKLDENDLPFYYDSRFDVGIAEVSPDFYIKNPFNGKIFLWEFFGSFNHPTYGTKMNDKMATYVKIGFIENDNLIVTFEHHLRDTNRIQEIIDKIIW